MKKFSVSIVTALTVAAFATAAQATIIFDSSFTSADGWVDGGIGFGGANPDTIVGAGSLSLSDTAGAGILNGATTFGRALIGWGAGTTEASVEGLAVGSTITVTASGLTFSTTGGNNLMVLGLSNVDSVNILGNSSLASGGHLVLSGTDIFAQPDSFAVNPGSGADTGMNVGDTFDFSVVFTAEGGGTFEIDQQINGSSVFSQPGQTLDFGKSGTDTTGFIQDFGASPGFTVDGLTFDITVIPEPSTIALAFLGFVGLMARRVR